MKTINTPKGEDTALVVKIPEGAYEIVIGKIKGLQSLVCCYGSDAKDHPHDRVIRLPEGNWKILGTVNKKGEVSFNVEPFIEIGGMYYGTLPFEAWNQKFVKMLEANGLYINNPIPNAAYIWPKDDMFEKQNEHFLKWKEAEKSTLQENECYLVLLKIV